MLQKDSTSVSGETFVGEYAKITVAAGLREKSARRTRSEYENTLHRVFFVLGLSRRPTPPTAAWASFLQAEDVIK